MRVLWLSPWMRTLARVHVDALHNQGAECLLVTSDRHPESDAARDYELVLDPRPKDPASWRPLRRALATARAFRPDVVVVELVWDPRWLAFARLAPVVHLIHDDRPHDPTEERPGWQRALFARWTRRAARVVAFSEYVQTALADRGVRAEVVPLTSDLPFAAVPARPAERRDVVLLGRIGPYKNIPVAFDAWRTHVAGPAWRGDRLVVIGDGELRVGLPPHTEWRRGPYSYRDVLPTIAGAKASLVHYRQASQSGVQLLSLQLGVTPIVSPAGALPEFQPPGEQPVGIDDVAGLAAALDRLADPGLAGARGEAAARHFADRFGPDQAAAALLKVFAGLD
jgi:glycosyltransferase involved in cell wall biosynthesis